jgi:two-component system, NarL family, response regulator NreC
MSRKQGNQLTAREKQVLQMLAEGLTIEAIAKFLCLSIQAVEAYRVRIMIKTQTQDLSGLVKFAIHEGLIEFDLI